MVPRMKEHSAREIADKTLLIHSSLDEEGYSAGEIAYLAVLLHDIALAVAMKMQNPVIMLSTQPRFINT